MSEFKVVLIIPVLLILAVMAGCGGDDDPNGPVTADGLVAVNGLYYKGTMGSADLDTAMVFAVKDKSGSFINDRWIFFTRIEGDGQISADSLKSDTSGTVELEYDFSGSLGHAVIRATDRQTDTIDVVLRADILTPTVQGQYILLDDTYGDIITFNGSPASLDVIPDVPEIMVANYEAALGVVFVLYDVNEDGALDNTAPVYGIIVVDSVYPQPPDGSTKSARYGGTTIEGIGMGANFWDDVYPVFGTPVVVVNDDDPNLPSWIMECPALHLNFWCLRDDTTVYQIDIQEAFDDSLFPVSGVDGDEIMKAVRSHYRTGDLRREDDRLPLDR